MIMKQVLYCLIVIFFARFTLAAQTQEPPAFETTIWFEDAVGNRDSVVVGYDTTANVRFNPTLGESHIAEPFADILDVRVAHLLDYRYQGRILSKKIITQAEKPFLFQGCYAASGVVCFIKARHQPVTISWDVNPFNKKCLQSSFITPNQRWELVFPFELDWSTIRAQCMRYSPYELYIADAHVPNNELPYKTIHQGDTVFGVAIKFAFDAFLFPLCRNTPSSEPSSNISPSLIMPNPATEVITVGGTTEEHTQLITISNISGRILRQITPSDGLKPTSILVEDLPSGIYVLMEHLSRGKIRTGRFVKL